MKHFFVIIVVCAIFFASHTYFQADRKPAQTTNAETLDYSTLGWYPTFVDEFDSANEAIIKGANPECFSKKAKCATNHGWATDDCPTEYASQLKDLNKCNWKVYDFYNYMDFSSKEGEGINSFHPSKVKVENGKLILSADRSPVDKNQIDCKNKVTDPNGWEYYTKKCGIYSGGVETHEWEENGKKMGFSQAYGRFEVVGKLSKGQGSWPAFWLVPQEGHRYDLPQGTKSEGCGWPHSGELDILESWSDAPNSVKSGYITGYCDPNLAMTKGFARKVSAATSSYHLYGLEWTPDYIRFIEDDKIIGTIHNGDKLKTKDRNTGKYKLFKKRGWIPWYAFSWILNLSIEKGDGKKKEKVNLDTFYHQELVIDSVRVYRKCSPEDDQSKCVHFAQDHADVRSYNSYNNETAFADINVFPNPVDKNADGNVTVRFTPFQSCKVMKLDVTSLNGQIMPIESNEAANPTELYNDSVIAKMDVYRKFNVSQYPAGMYIIRATYSGCGEYRTGQGNQVFKLLVY